MHHEGVDVRFMFFHFFLPNKNMLKIGIEYFVSIAFWDHLVGVDDDETVPNQGMYFSFCQSSLQLSEYFRCIDDVHFDEISFEGVGLSAFLNLVCSGLEGSAGLQHS